MFYIQFSIACCNKSSSNLNEQKNLYGRAIKPITPGGGGQFCHAP